MHDFIIKISLMSPCIFLMLFSLNLYSQEASGMDKDFINSLPADLQKEMKREDKGVDVVDKLLQSKSSSLKNNEALKLIKEQLSQLEERILSEGDEMGSDNLERFGASFFRSTQSTFMPVNVPNLNSDYVVDVGDKLSINIIGTKSKTLDNLTLQRDGSISIEDFGKVYLAGNKFSEAQKIINNFIQTKSIGNEVFVTLTELRDVQIIILGAAENPGIYTVSGGSNVLHAINIAGGINDSGSYRNIKILRSGNQINNFDLYDTLILGRSNIFDFNLRSGDTVFIKPVNFYVPVSGGVNQPAIYDIKLGETASDVIKFAGGFSQDSYNLNTLTLERDSSNGVERIQINKVDLDQTILQPRDSITVPMYSKEIQSLKQVTISGAIHRPGVFNLEEGETLSQLVFRAGGYKDNAYEFGGMFYRKSVENLSEIFGQRVYSDTIAFLVSNLGQGSGGGSSQPLNGDFLKVLIEEFKSQDSLGRIITEFDTQKLRANRPLDIKLEDKDVIEIPTMPQHVYLFGDFNQSVILPYNPDFSMAEYMNLAAGKKYSATKHLILIDPNGMSHYYEKQLFSGFNKTNDIYPGSIIYLPRELGKIEGVMFAAAIAPILSSLTLSLASINAINKY